MGEADGGVWVRPRRGVVGDALEGAVVDRWIGLRLRRWRVVLVAGEGFGFVFFGHVCFGFQRDFDCGLLWWIGGGNFSIQASSQCDRACCGVGMNMLMKREINDDCYVDQPSCVNFKGKHSNRIKLHSPPSTVFFLF